MTAFTPLQGIFFWGFLLAFGGLMYVLAPRVRSESGYFQGHDEAGRPASRWALTARRAMRAKSREPAWRSRCRVTSLTIQRVAWS